MIRPPLRIATTIQLESSVRDAGFDAYLLPELPSLDFNRTLDQRIEDGKIYGPFLEKNDIDLVIDFNTTALTLVRTGTTPGEVALTTAQQNIPYVACYLDPVTATMANVSWADHWTLLESPTWIKAVWDKAHCDELTAMGIPNVFHLPMAVTDHVFDTRPLEPPIDSPVVTFIGHPASGWFRHGPPVEPKHLFAGLTAAAVRADMPDVPFHHIHYDLYGFAEPPRATDAPQVRHQKSFDYFQQKFLYHAYLAVKQRDRFVHFLQHKLGDTFELIGDHWGELYGLKHAPREWDKQKVYQRMRRVAVSLNLIKGNAESSLNLRHFEITGCGGLMLSYQMPELASLFKIGEECDVFHDEQELLEKIHYYASHPKERAAMAQAGQQRTLAEHLYKHRILKIVEVLRSSKALPAPPVEQELACNSMETMRPR